MLNKVFKWIMWALMIISVVIAVWGFVQGFTGPKGDSPVSVLLDWAYIMTFIAIGIVVIGGIAVATVNNPKSFIKILIGLVVIAAICAVVYFTAPGSPAIGYNGTPVSQGTLKLTDSLLNLTYLTSVLSIIAILVGEIVSAVRNK